MRPRDPLTTWQRRRLAVRACGLLALVGAGVFALGPVEPRPMPNLAIEPAGPAPAVASDVAPFDIAPFATVRLWPADPRLDGALMVDQRITDEPSSDLRLVGLLRERETIRAALYDAASDRFAVVGPGETFAGVTVASIEGTTVTLQSRRGEERPSLQHGPRSETAP